MLDKFFNYENYPTNRLYVYKDATSFPCWKCYLFLTLLTSSVGFLIFSKLIFSNHTFWNYFPAYFFIPLCSLFLMLFKFHEPLGNMMSNSLTESWRLRFEKDFIYDDKPFKTILEPLSPFMTQDERSIVIDAVVRKNFSAKEFNILYESYVSYQKSTYNVSTEEDTQKVNFFNQKTQ